MLAMPAGAAEIVLDGGFDDPTHAAWFFEKYDTDSIIDRSTTDSAGDPGSGSLSLAKVLAQPPNSLRASQCVAVVPGAEYALSGTLFLPSASLDLDGVAYLDVTWNTSAECNSASPGGYQSNLTAIPRDAWTAIGPVLLDAPLGVHGARIYAGVVVYQPPREGAPQFFAASWDDVSLVPEPGGIGSLAALGALATLTRRR
jgi:hypothetical protein